jgi:hypothetical protein
VVLIVTFVGLAAFWDTPPRRDRWRPLPGWLGRVPASRPGEAACGAIGVALLGLVVWSGLFGRQDANENFAPTFVYVVFWIGLVPASALLGDVFRAFNPWRALGRGGARVVGRVLRFEPAPLQAYPERLGHWPAAAGIGLFTWLELIAPSRSAPRASPSPPSSTPPSPCWGWSCTESSPGPSGARRSRSTSTWFSRIAPFETRDGRVGLRPPLAALLRLRPLPGTTAAVAVMIGSVSFDGAGEGAFQSVVPALRGALESLGPSPSLAGQLAFGVRYAVAVLLAYALFRAGIGAVRWATQTPRGEPAEGAPRGGAKRLTAAFVTSLAPIAFAYVGAHYVRLLVYRS